MGRLRRTLQLHASDHPDARQPMVMVLTWLRRPPLQLSPTMTDLTSPSQLLEQQHRRIDDGIKVALTGTGSPQALIQSLELLRLHIYLEEQVLFPPLERAGLTMPIFVMQREHGLMWPLIQSLLKSDADVQADGRELFQLLQVHNPKEEQILYKAADQVDEGGPDGALLQALQQGQMPADWACKMAQR